MVRVAIVEDQWDIPDGLRMLIDGTAGFRVTGSFRSMEDTLAALGRELPDIVLVDGLRR